MFQVQSPPKLQLGPGRVCDPAASGVLPLIQILALLSGRILGGTAYSFSKKGVLPEGNLHYWQFTYSDATPPRAHDFYLKNVLVKLPSDPRQHFDEVEPAAQV